LTPQYNYILLYTALPGPFILFFIFKGNFINLPTPWPIIGLARDLGIILITPVQIGKNHIRSRTNGAFQRIGLAFKRRMQFFFKAVSDKLQLLSGKLKLGKP